MKHERPHRGGTDTWLTPRSLTEVLGAFDLDPCAAPLPRPWEHAARNYSLPQEDGLLLPWEGRVWLNPPYGPRAGEWLRRLAEHGNGIALVASRTETAAFHRYVWECATGLLFLEGRLTFCYPDGRPGESSAGHASVLIAYGRDNVRALWRSELKGHLVELREVAKQPAPILRLPLMQQEARDA